MLDFLEVADILEGIDDDLHFVAVVHFEFDGAVEDAVVAGDDEFLHVDVQLTGDDTCHLVEQTDAVDAGHVYGCVKEGLPVHVPFGIDDAVAETGFQFGGHVAVAPVDLQVVFVVDEPEDVIAWDGPATFGEEKSSDIAVVDEERLLAVEVLGHDEGFAGLFSLVGIFLLFLLGVEEGYESAPSCLLRSFLLALEEFVDVFVAEDDVLVAQCLEEFLRLLDVVELTQAVDGRSGEFQAMILQKLAERVLSGFLDLAVVAPQDGLDLSFGLGCGGEIDPGGVHVLRL